jgi:hypothetical protein
LAIGVIEALVDQVTGWPDQRDCGAITYRFDETPCE